MKTATKKASKKTAPKHAEPSADASPRHKAIVAAARGRGRGAHPTAPQTAPPAEPAPAPQEAPGPAHDASAADNGPTIRDAAAATFESREPATPPAWFPTEARPDEPFARIADLGATWLRYLEANGSRATTVDGYGRDLALAYRVFGEDAPPRLIDGDEIAKFEASDACTIKRNGNPRAKPSVDRTRRVLRLAMTWAHAAGRIASNPYAK